MKGFTYFPHKEGLPGSSPGYTTKKNVRKLKKNENNGCLSRQNDYIKDVTREKRETVMRIDLCDLDGMTIADLRKMLEDYSDEDVMTVREEYIPGGFGSKGHDTEFLYIETTA